MQLLYGIKNEAYKAVRGDERTPGIQEQFRCSEIELFAVKNQSVAFQLLLLGSDDFLLSVSDSASFDKTGIIENIRLKVIVEQQDGMIETSMNIIGFVEDDDRLYKADILLSQDYIHVKKDRLQPVWIELYIPASAKAGVYNGKVDIYSHTGFGDESKTGSVSFKLNIMDVTLPKPSEYSFYLDLWQHNSNIARKHETPLWSDKHFTVMEKYIKSLAELGQKAITIIASEIPWSGQSCYMDSTYPSDLFEYSMIRVKKDSSGRLILDFSVVDRYIDLCFKYGINKEIEVFGLINIWVCEEKGFGKISEELPDGIRVRYLDERDGCFKYIDTLHELKTYIKEIEKHFIDRGLIEIVRIVADEPADLELYNQRLNFLKQVAPSFKFKAAICTMDFVKKYSQNNKNDSCQVDDFVALFSMLAQEPELIGELKKQLRGRFYWYVCCVPDLPNTFLMSNILETYAIAWLTQYMQLDGFLRWNYTVWPENPRERLSYRYPMWKAGDTNFVYPSNNGAPLLTLRYKALLKAIQTYELISMLKKINPYAEEIICQAFKKIFRFKSLEEFKPDAHNRQKALEELISLDYKDYVDAMKIVIEGIIKS